MNERALSLSTSPKGSWVQVERKTLEKWAKLTAEHPRASQLMLTITANLGRGNALVISQLALSRMCECSLSTVQRAIKILKANNWIEARQIGSTGAVNAYIVNDRVAWQGNRKGQRYSLFSAVVYAAEDEQPDRARLDAQEPLERIPPIFAGEYQLPTGEGLPPPSQPSLPALEPDLPAREEGAPTGGGAMRAQRA